MLSLDSYLYHGSPIGDINVLEPRKLSTPGGEINSPEGVYASDDPAFAAAHAFRWGSSEGIDLYCDTNENGDSVVHLEIPEEISERLNQITYIYKVSSKTFKLLDIPPEGRNFRTLEKVECIGHESFKTVTAAIEKFGGKVIYKIN
jgi:hypothetical protein